MPVASVVTALAAPGAGTAGECLSVVPDGRCESACLIPACLIMVPAGDTGTGDGPAAVPRWAVAGAVRVAGSGESGSRARGRCTAVAGAVRVAGSGESGSRARGRCTAVAGAVRVLGEREGAGLARIEVRWPLPAPTAWPRL